MKYLIKNQLPTGIVLITSADGLTIFARISVYSEDLCVVFSNILFSEDSSLAATFTNYRTLFTNYRTFQTHDKAMYYLQHWMSKNNYTWLPPELNNLL